MSRTPFASGRRSIAHKLSLAAGLTAGLAALTTASDAEAQSCDPPRILFVVDASSSMLGTIPDGANTITKWEAVQNAANAVLTTFPDGAQYGLVTFPGAGGSCDPGDELVGVGVGNANTILNEIDNLLIPANSATPAGQTLMEQSFNPDITDPAHANYVIFLSDGWQWCDLPPSANPTNCATAGDCTLMGVGTCPTCDSGPNDGCFCVRNWPVLGVEALATAGVTTFVVGFGDEVDALTLNQAADAGGTALAGCDPNSSTPSCFLEATSPTELTQTLSSIIQAVVTQPCMGDCDIVGTQTCGPSGWSECDAPPTQDCTTYCGSDGTQECVNGVLGECVGICDETGGAGGAGTGTGTGTGMGTGGVGNAGGAGNTGNTGDDMGDTDPDDESGCACRTAPGSDRDPVQTTGAGLLALGLAGLFASRRRRGQKARR